MRYVGVVDGFGHHAQCGNTKERKTYARTEVGVQQQNAGTQKHKSFKHPHKTLKLHVAQSVQKRHFLPH
jgi:hypothetical protein